MHRRGECSWELKFDLGRDLAASVGSATRASKGRGVKRRRSIRTVAFARSTSFQRSVGQTKGGLRIKSPKTKHGRPIVSTSPWLVTELRAHRVRQQGTLGLGKALQGSLVFARWDGEIRSPYWLTQKCAQAMIALGFDCTLHNLRTLTLHFDRGGA
jgi:hypothetical protein